jgi:hypothetical protein
VQHPETDDALIVVQAFLIFLLPQPSNTGIIKCPVWCLPQFINTPGFHFQTIVKFLRLPFVRCFKRLSNSLSVWRDEIAVPCFATLFD